MPGLDYCAGRLLLVFLFWPMFVSAEGEHERNEPRHHPITNASAEPAELPEAVLCSHQVLVGRSAAGHRRSGGHVEAIQENGTASMRLRLRASTRSTRPSAHQTDTADPAVRSVIPPEPHYLARMRMKFTYFYTFLNSYLQN